MIKVPLFTSKGEYVITAIIPAFLTPPDVLVWGVRTFLHRLETPMQKEGYFECFTVGVVETEVE